MTKSVGSVDETDLNRALLARQMLISRQSVWSPTCSSGCWGSRATGAGAAVRRPLGADRGFQRDDLARLIRDRSVVVRATLFGARLPSGTRQTNDYLALFDPRFSRCFLAPASGRCSAIGTSGVDFRRLCGAGRRLFAEQPRTFTRMRAALSDSSPTATSGRWATRSGCDVPLVSTPDDSRWGFRGDPDFADAATWLGKAPTRIARRGDWCVRYLAASDPRRRSTCRRGRGSAAPATVLNALRPRLQTFRDERKRELFDLPDAPRPPAETPVPVRFLPGFDNAILGHADRSRIIADEHRPKVTTKNLQVLPTFLVDGFVAGTWKLSGRRAEAKLTLSPFGPLTAAVKARSHEGRQGVDAVRAGRRQADDRVRDGLKRGSAIVVILPSRLVSSVRGVFSFSIHGRGSIPQVEAGPRPQDRDDLPATALRLARSTTRSSATSRGLLRARRVIGHDVLRGVPIRGVRIHRLLPYFLENGRLVLGEGDMEICYRVSTIGV